MGRLQDACPSTSKPTSSRTLAGLERLAGAVGRRVVVVELLLGDDDGPHPPKRAALCGRAAPACLPPLLLRPPSSGGKQHAGSDHGLVTLIADFVGVVRWRELRNAREALAVLTRNEPGQLAVKKPPTANKQTTGLFLLSPEIIQTLFA